MSLTSSSCSRPERFLTLDGHRMLSSSTDFPVHLADVSHDWDFLTKKASKNMPSRTPPLYSSQNAISAFRCAPMRRMYDGSSSSLASNPSDDDASSTLPRYPFIDGHQSRVALPHQVVSDSNPHTHLNEVYRCVYSSETLLF